MAEDAYTRSALVHKTTDDGKALHINRLMAEIKAASEGIPLHEKAIAITYGGGASGNLVNTITITDASSDTGFDCDVVGTCNYTGDTLNSVAWVFDPGGMNVTMTETFTYTTGKITGIARALT